MSHADDFVYQAILDGDMEIDSSGRIWKIARRCFYKKMGKILRHPCQRHRAESSTGKYLIVALGTADEKRVATAQRLVWMHFNGAIPDGMTINHKNGKTFDNRPANLELATPSEQQLHAIRVLGKKPWINFFEKQIGSDNGRAKLVESQVRRIKISKETNAALAAKYGVSIGAISKIRNGRTWTKAL